MQIFEDVAPPVDNIKQSFNINHDMPNYDILLGNHNYNDDVNLYVCSVVVIFYSDANTLLLFEPRKLMLEIFDGSTPVDAKLFCEVTLYDGKVKISETVRFSVLPEQQEELAALKFLFKTTSTDNVFILFRINRQFCGEFTETKDEMYSKPEKVLIIYFLQNFVLQGQRQGAQGTHYEEHTAYQSFCQSSQFQHGSLFCHGHSSIGSSSKELSFND